MSSLATVGAVEYVVGDVPVHYVEHGEGLPVLALHGAGVDHREVMACLDPVFDALTGYRRIYPDLPGMGRTPAPETIRSADDVLDVLLAFIDGVIGDQPLLVLGTRLAGTSRRRSPAEDRSRWWAWRCCARCWQASATCPNTTSRPLGRHRRRRVPRLLHGPDSRDAGSIRAVRPTRARLADQSALARIGERWDLTTRPQDQVPYRSPDPAGDRSPGLHGRLLPAPGSCSSSTHAPPSPCWTGQVMRSRTSSPNCSALWSPNGSTGSASTPRGDAVSATAGRAGHGETGACP